MVETSVPMRRNPEVLFRELDGETVLYHPPTDGVVTLDTIGSVVWRALELPGSIDELVPDLADAFGADPEVVRADVVELIDRLVALDIVSLS